MDGQNTVINLPYRQSKLDIHFQAIQILRSQRPHYHALTQILHLLDMTGVVTAEDFRICVYAHPEHSSCWLNDCVFVGEENLLLLAW